MHQLKVEAFTIFANFLALFSNEKAVLAETLLVHSIPWLGGGGARLVGCNEPNPGLSRTGTGPEVERITTYYCQLGSFRENNNNESKLVLE